MQVSVRLGERIYGRRNKEGDEAYLKCSVSGASSPVTRVTWHQDRRELTTEDVPSFLVIRNVKPGDAGRYQRRWRGGEEPTFRPPRQI